MIGTSEVSDYHDVVHQYETETGLSFEGMVMITSLDGNNTRYKGICFEIGPKTGIAQGDTMVTNHVYGESIAAVITIRNIAETEHIYEALSRGRCLGETIVVGGLDFDLFPSRDPEIIEYCHLSKGFHVDLRSVQGKVCLALNEEFFADVDSGEELLSTLRKLRGL